jgi:hypothetical protein
MSHLSMPPVVSQICSACNLGIFGLPIQHFGQFHGFTVTGI